MVQTSARKITGHFERIKAVELDAPASETLLPPKSDA
jgi:hypothetical protein